MSMSIISITLALVWLLASINPIAITIPVEKPELPLLRTHVKRSEGGPLLGGANFPGWRQTWTLY